MKLVLTPSLQHILIVKIVVSLWNQNDIKNLIIIMSVRFTPSFIHTSEKWKKIEDRVIEKVPLLSLPHLLKEKVLSFIKPIGIQILEWIKFHLVKFHLHLNLPTEFCWKPEGTIDRKKTAELLIKDDNLDTDARYMLACIYCFEDDIKIFWKNMPEIVKQSISNKSRIIQFWTCNMRGRGLGNVSYGYQFQQSACLDNQVAAAYFLQKLTPSEREHYLVDTAKLVRNADVLCFLLSEMEEEQQIKILKNDPPRVLSCFLQWPLQSFFFEVANYTWDFLSVVGFNDVLKIIIDKVTYSSSEWNYLRLFREFWQKCPIVLKNSIGNGIHQSWHWLLPSLFNIKDKETIRFIVQDVTPAVKEKFINYEKINNFCQRSIRANDWDFLEFCIRECFPTKNEMLQFKEEFEKSHYLKSAYFKEHFARNEKKWDNIFIFPDDSVFKYEKRSAEEGECRSSKRFQSIQ